MQFKDNYFFLSTFHISKFSLIIQGKECWFTNVEAAYQAQKNPDIADKFIQVKGLEAKRLGQSLKITVPDWNKKHLYAMANALHAKFSNNLLLKQLQSIDTDIIYDNPYGDTYWGVSKNQGKNILGKLLTCVKNSNNDLNKLYNYITDNLLSEEEN